MSPATFFYLGALPYLGLHFTAGFRDFPAEAWQPILLFRLTGLPALGSGAALPAYAVLALLLGLAAAGKGGRPARVAACLLSLWVFGSRYNFGVELAQVDAPLVLGLAILAVAGNGAPTLLRALFAFVIFSAGAFKVASTGLAWLTHDALRVFLEIRHGAEPASASAAFALAHPWLTRAGSAGALLLELAFPLSLLGGRAVRLLSVSLVGVFLMGTWVFLGHPFLLSLFPFAGAFACLREAPGLKLAQKG